MSMPVPSREALRVLSRLCQSGSIASRCHTQTIRRPFSNSRWGVRETALRPQGLAQIQSRSKTTLVDSPEPQTFANDPSRYDPQNRTGPEPPQQGTIDPQSEASAPILPDISNYYTLFPQTLPGGPPRPKSSIPDSSELSDGEPAKPTFDLNPRVLRKEFLQLQSIHHPDKFPAGSVAHQRAYALSTLLNNAYKTLSDPLSRSQYLLQILYDIDVTNEDNSAHQGDQEDLMVVLEAQEELEDAAEGTKETAEAVVQKLKEENASRMRETEKHLGAAFEAGDSQRARDEAVRLKYWHTLESSLREWTPGRQLTLIH